MSQLDTIQQNLTKDKYEPVSSTHKLSLLFQRSFRYSYRQRCCKCCPNILCEILLPIILIILLALSRYGMNNLSEQMNNSNGTFTRETSSSCSQDLNTPPSTSNDLLANCFKYPDSYKGGKWNPSHSIGTLDYINLIFQPITDDIEKLVNLASKHLSAMKCTQTNVWQVNNIYAHYIDY